ncbi:MAG: inositol monophosphatase [Candidatus Chromulinivorax sp.]|nr:inositol monophosphatase [Candidatus Chromulinivorax sp.]
MNNLQYFDQLQDVMVRSGQFVMQHFRNDYMVFEKHGFSIVTSVDIENEKFLKNELAKIVPQAGFLAEESGESGVVSLSGHSPNRAKPGDFMWVIDPIDGTRNFVKGIPHFCIMVALTYKDEPIVAAIYQPVTQELYYAEKGKGLWLQGKQIHFVDRLMASKSAIVVCSDTEYRHIKLKLKENKVQVSRRYFGSAGMDAIYLAVGNIDLVMFNNIAWWDVAAGMLLIQEAGGLICHYEKSAKRKDYGTLHAGNSLFFDDCSW